MDNETRTTIATTGINELRADKGSGTNTSTHLINVSTTQSQNSLKWIYPYKKQRV